MGRASFDVQTVEFAYLMSSNATENTTATLWWAGMKGTVEGRDWIVSVIVNELTS